MPTLEFKGKPFVHAHHLSVPFRELVIAADKSLPSAAGPSLDDNLIIQGDNLEALKALLPKYAGKVDCIFIDPPYNTGKEGWCYNDSVNSPLMKQWLGRVIDRDDLERHDKWACMIWPRLQLLREMMSENGVIFICLDDNEIGNLRCILDEMFGANNFVGNIVWKNVTDNNPTQVAIEHEYILCFAKDRSRLVSSWKSKISDVKALLEDMGAKLASQFSNDRDLEAAYREWFRINKNQLWPLDRYKYIDRDGVFTGSQSVHNPGKEGYHYDIVHPVTKMPCKEPLMGYRFPPDTIERLIAEDRFIYGDDETKIVELKVYARDFEDKLASVVDLDGRIAAYELRDIFRDRAKAFDNPKPSQLVERVLSFCTSRTSIVLDSFAGSGTTGHAVLKLNASDNGSRSFVLVEGEDYADNVTAERIRRAIGGAGAEGKFQARSPLSGSFTYCELGEPMDMARFFDGATPPAFEQVARYVAYTATGATLDVVADGADHFVGEAGGYRLHLIYLADAGFMRSDAAMLDMATAERIAAAGAESGKPILVFAAGKYMGQKQLTAMGLTFAQLPYAIHRMLPGDGAGE